jgi:hypothetical protein
MKIVHLILIFCLQYIRMTNGSTGEKIKEKVKETIGAGEGGGQNIKEKVKETIGMGGGGVREANREELGPGAATDLEDEVAKTSSDSPTKRVEGPGKALGKEEGTE